ncbi:hypothetical protein F2Q68_00033277 [Brassica cretica]|uniref:Uncharacterized protein n=1 Tax=Brassica cretica TaxID=69181 RepID=A0A8S9GEH5_BRACR|nr:hypothetical protein F2Q68_00033277 [Brassica cretica]
MIHQQNIKVLAPSSPYRNSSAPLKLFEVAPGLTDLDSLWSATVLSYPPWLFLPGPAEEGRRAYSSYLPLCSVTRLKSTTSLFRISAPFIRRGLRRHGCRRHQAPDTAKRKLDPLL